MPINQTYDILDRTQLRESGMAPAKRAVLPESHESPCQVKFLISDFEGGTANHIRSVAKHWNPHQVRPEIISTDPRAAESDICLEVTCLSDRQVLDRLPFTQTIHLLETFKLLRKRDVDVLHTYFFWPIIYGRVLKRLGVVSTLVENREDEGFNWSDREYALLRATRRAPDRIVCVTQSIADLVEQREAVCSNRVQVIHNGIELPRSVDPGEANAVRRRFGLEQKDLVVGMVANYDRPVKGMSELLRGIPSVVDAVPNARFLVVGRGPRCYQDRADELGIKDFIIFAGPQDDVDKFYTIMDISVLTSLSEGLSLVLLESMAHGLPVVATNVGGNPDIVKDGSTGYLVPPADPDTFADRVVKLLRDPDIRDRMGQAGQKRVRRQFSISDVADKYENMYLGLLRDKLSASNIESR